MNTNISFFHPISTSLTTHDPSHPIFPMRCPPNHFYPSQHVSYCPTSMRPRHPMPPRIHSSSSHSFSSFPRGIYPSPRGMPPCPRGMLPPSLNARNDQIPSKKRKNDKNLKESTMKDKYYCDYCDKYFHNTTESRQKHFHGKQHQHNVQMWYDSFLDPSVIAAREGQKLISQSSSSYPIHPALNPGFHSNVISTPTVHSFIPSFPLGVEDLPPSLIPPTWEDFYRVPFIDWGE